MSIKEFFNQFSPAEKLSAAFALLLTVKCMLVRGLTFSMMDIIAPVVIWTIFVIVLIWPMRFYFKKLLPHYTLLTIQEQKQVKIVGFTVGIMVALFLNVFWFPLGYPDMVGMLVGCLTAYAVTKK